jgi:hypothetical protein
MTNDQRVGGHFLHLYFDTDLGNELNLFNPNGGQNWSGTTYGTTTMAANYLPLIAVGLRVPIFESTGSVSGRIGQFNSGVNPVTGAIIALPTGTYTVGTARFVANGAVPDGADVFLGFEFGYDGVLDDSFNMIPDSQVFFGTASVSAPEPGTASLVALGLVGILLARRRHRRS